MAVYPLQLHKKVYQPLIVLFVGLLALSGCAEPSSLGRFKRAPITSIILPNLGVVDEEPEVFAGARDPEPKDLIPDRREYVIGPGDVLNLSVFELFSSYQDWRDNMQVSETGRITMPVIGTFRVTGQTELELTDTIKRMLSPDFIKDPKVSVVVVGSRERVYSISGALRDPGRYPLGETDFRISEAMAQAGGIPQVNADYAYVIRTVTTEQIRQDMETTYRQEQEELGMYKLQTEPDGDVLPPMPMPPSAAPAIRPPDQPGSEYDKLQESLGQENVIEESMPQEAVPGEPQQPQQNAPQDDEDELLESLTPMSLVSRRVIMMAPRISMAAQKTILAKDIPAVKSTISRPYMAHPDENVIHATDFSKPLKIIREGGRFHLAPTDAGSDWQPPKPQTTDESPGTRPEYPSSPRPPWQEPDDQQKPWQGLGDEELASRIQQVIRIDLKKLRGGDLSQNVVIKAGDEIRVPYNSVGEFYVMGQVARAGPYSLTGRRLTVKHAIAVAGPLTSLADPQRCDIIRRIGEDREVFYRVNLQKLMQGTAHDMFLKPNDIINVGSHPVARWVATVRNSFRSTYGFGFVYDRNFSDKDAGH